MRRFAIFQFGDFPESSILIPICSSYFGVKLFSKALSALNEFSCAKKNFSYVFTKAKMIKTTSEVSLNFSTIREKVRPVWF